MTFDNVYQALEWFFNFKERNAPRCPGNHSYIFSGNRARQSSVMEIWDAFHKINDALMSLSPRNYAILKDCFTDGPPDRYLGKKLGISDRRIRQIKNEMISMLELRMQRNEILAKPRHEKPKFAFG